MSTVPLDVLEQRAAETRRRLHQTASDLRAKVASVRQELDPELQARRHFAAFSLTTSVLALLTGWAVTSMFVRR